MKMFFAKAFAKSEFMKREWFDNEVDLDEEADFRDYPEIDGEDIIEEWENDEDWELDDVDA